METSRKTTTHKLSRAALLLLWLSMPSGCSSAAQDAIVLPAALETSDPFSDARDAPQMLEHERYYSAFDDEHTYHIALAPNADADRLDPLDLSRVVWRYDSGYLRAEPYPALPAGVLLTPLKAGKSIVRVSATTATGQVVRDSAEIQITEADAASWDAGDLAFRDADAVRPQLALPAACADLANLPSNEEIGATGCPSCHDPAASITVPLTNQLQAFSDEEVMRIYAKGEVPSGYEHVAPFMRTSDEPGNRCFLRKTHAWQMSDALSRALLLKIRSQLPYESPYDP